MVQVTYPGVYVVEVPSGVHTIAGVSTSVAAFVDRFARGPDNKAVQIFGLGDFEREFGGLASYSPASYAIQQFFLNGGSEAWVVRVGRSDTAQTATLKDKFEAASVDLPGPKGKIVRVSAGRQRGGVSVKNPGSWGNGLRIDVDYNTSMLPNANIDPGGVEVQDELFNLTVSQVEVRNGRTFVVQSETFSNLTMRPGVRNNALAVVNNSSLLVQLDNPDPPYLPLPALTPPTAFANFRPFATGTTGIKPATFPSTGTAVKFTVDPDVPSGGLPVLAAKTVTLNFPTSITDYPSLRPYLEAAIRDSMPNEPLISGATVEFARGRFRVLLGRAGVDFDPRATITFSDATVAAVPGTTSGVTNADLGLHATTASVSPQQYALSEGGDGIDITDTELRGNLASKRGIYALEDVSLFNILCLPAAADLASDTQMRNAYAAAASYCEDRRAFLIIDVPETTDTLAEMQAWLTTNDTLRHKNAAVYFPRVRIADPLNQGRLMSAAASGTLAGVYARTDASRGVWKAPAGIEAQLRGVQELAVSLTDRENGALNPLAANVLRSFPVYGIVAWGARTLEGADQRASEWKYVPIRRLALFLEESLFRGTKWVVFEPNDEPLWAQIRMNLNAFMMGLFRQGAFQGSSPKDAFFVKCDAQTTTQNDRNLGIVNIEVGFAPLKPAEFVVIRIQQIAGDLG
jgi:phage tail sheath protein FI